MAKSTRPRSEELTEITINGVRMRVGTFNGYPYWECCTCPAYDSCGNPCGVDTEIGENDAKYYAEKHSKECRYRPDRPKRPTDD